MNWKMLSAYIAILGLISVTFPFMSVQFELICKEGLRIEIDSVPLFLNEKFVLKYWCFGPQKMQREDIEFADIHALTSISLLIKILVLILLTLPFHPIGFLISSLLFSMGFLIDIILTFCHFNVNICNLAGKAIVCWNFPLLVWVPLLIVSHFMHWEKRAI